MLRLRTAHGWPRAALALSYNARPLRAANDNGAVRSANDDSVLTAALRLFAANGLAAAERAEQLAMDADEAGDHLAAQRWVAVCHTLDRSRARKLAEWRRARQYA